MQIKTNMRAGKGGRCAGGGGGSTGGGSNSKSKSKSTDSVEVEVESSPVYVPPVSRCVGI